MYNQSYELAVLIISEIFYIAALGILFKKANIKGWKAFIPIYNEYTMSAFCSLKKQFWISTVLGFSSIALFYGSIIMFMRSFLSSLNKYYQRTYVDDIPVIMFLLGFLILLITLYIKSYINYKFIGFFTTSKSLKILGAIGVFLPMVNVIVLLIVGLKQKELRVP